MDWKLFFDSFGGKVGWKAKFKSGGERGCEGGRRRHWEYGERGEEGRTNKAVNYTRRIFFRRLIIIECISTS